MEKLRRTRAYQSKKRIGRVAAGRLRHPVPSPMTPEQQLVREMFACGVAPAEIACCQALPIESVIRLLETCQ